MKVAFISLGCDKNTVDTEMMLGILDEAGHELVYDEEEADAVVVNTCAFILDAKQESIDNILRLAKLKTEGRLRYIIVTGCLGQRYTDDILQSIPEVDAILGISSFDRVAEALDELEKGGNKECVTLCDPIDAKPIYGHKRLLTTPIHYAYLKIAEGCDKRCTYCIIPKLRGRYRSIPMEKLIAEATDLAARGVKELILVAQETTLYGTDIYGKKQLTGLISGLARVEGIEHIRLLYCYPEEITDELIQLMKNEPKLYHYIDMPIQHVSDNVLKRMGRKTDESSLRRLIARLREEIPDICIRTTLIAGFPGESMADYRRLKAFVKDMRFNRLGVFSYSAEEGTAAAGMKHQIPVVLRNMRRNAIMKLQQRIVFDANKAMSGRELTVTIQGYIPKDGVYMARSYMDAPDVDGMIFIETDREYMSGEDIKVRITGAAGYDLVAVPADD